MIEAINRFKKYYADQFSAGASGFLCSYGEKIVNELRDATKRPRSTIYLFGNGGSHAISKCIEYALQTQAQANNQQIRIQTGIDIHKTTLIENLNHSGTSFVDTLRLEGADSRDLLLLISGSGDSDNLCEAAKYATIAGIRMFALVGSGGGQLREIVPAERCFTVSLNDQQLSEDIIQSLSCVLDEPLDQTGPWEVRASSVTAELAITLEQIPDTFIAELADAISETFYSRKFVWVLGLDHPSLSACAEHVAHNLYWDGIYEVDNPPPRLVFSSATACDFSGISNDRRRDIIETLTGMSELREQGVALIYAMSDVSYNLHSLLNHLGRLRVPTYLLNANGDLPKVFNSVIPHRTGLRRPQLHALCCQMLGHILGRVIRLKLIERNGSTPCHDIPDRSQFLMDHDLAQRRVLNA